MAGTAQAQTGYPNRPIQLVVTVPPGGAADFTGRLIGAKLADALGQPVVISNRAGAGGITAAVPARSVADVVALAKARPGELSFSSSGSGGAPHLAGEMFKSFTGTNLLHVPYRGSAPAVVDLIAGRITLMFDATPV